MRPTHKTNIVIHPEITKLGDLDNDTPVQRKPALMLLLLLLLLLLNTEWKQKQTLNACLILIFNTKQNYASQKICQMGPSYHVPHLSCLLQSYNPQMNKRQKKISSWTKWLLQETINAKLSASWS